jgi:hypothetical protein
LDEVVIAVDGIQVSATTSESSNAGQPGLLWVFIISFSTHTISSNANPPPLMKVPLRQGWNLISLPLVPDEPTITKVLKSQIDANTPGSVWAYIGTPKAWKFFTPPRTGTLTTMNDGVGYWVYMKADDDLYMKGTVLQPGALPPSYPLVTGWNLIGFKSQPNANETKTVGAYLSSIDGKYDNRSVWIYNNTAGAWVRADVNPSTGTVLHPGDVMWVYVNSAATFNPYPDLSLLPSFLHLRGMVRILCTMTMMDEESWSTVRLSSIS